MVISGGTSFTGILILSGGMSTTAFLPMIHLPPTFLAGTMRPFRHSSRIYISLTPSLSANVAGVWKSNINTSSLWSIVCVQQPPASVLYGCYGIVIKGLGCNNCRQLLQPTLLTL